jgi:hypothetical protein
MLCVKCLCTQERLNPEVAIILGAAACYRRAAVGSRNNDAHSDNSTPHAGRIYSVRLLICKVFLLLLRQRRGAAGNDLGTTIKFLR